MADPSTAGATSIPSFLSRRQDHIAGVRRLLATALSPAVMFAAFFLAWRWRNNPLGTELLCICGVMGFVSVLALCEFGVAQWGFLAESRNRLHALSQSGWPPSDDKTLLRSWFGRVVLATREIEQNSASAHQPLEVLPDPADIVAPIRAQAETATILLRWFATAAVLVGLLGTLYGLKEALASVASVIEALGTQPAVGSSTQPPNLAALAGPLKTLQFCFFGSAMGVATSIALSLLRAVYEADLDEHFGELEHALRARLPTLFPSWRSPTQRLATVAEQFVKQSDAMQQLISEVEGKTTQIQEAMVNTIETQLKGLPDKLITTIEGGLRKGTSDVLGETVQIRRDFEKEMRAKEDAIVIQARLAAETLQNLHDRVGQEFLTFQSSLDKRLTPILQNFADELKKAAGQTHDQAKAALIAVASLAEHSRDDLGKHRQTLAELDHNIKDAVLITNKAVETVSNGYISAITKSAGVIDTEFAAAASKITGAAITTFEVMQKAEALVGKLDGFATKIAAQEGRHDAFVTQVSEYQKRLEAIKGVLDRQISVLTVLVELDTANQEQTRTLLAQLKGQVADGASLNS